MRPDPLPDHLEHGLDVVLVGINPGLHSARRGHHFAGPGNRFWALLAESGLTGEKLGYERDHELPALGVGLTNIVSRATRSSGELRPEDFRRGRRELRDKIVRFRPRAVAFVGVTVFRAFWPELSDDRAPAAVGCGLRPETIEGAALFVLPNPSGRNAHFSYAEMLSYWRGLAGFLARGGRRAGAARRAVPLKAKK